MFAIGTETKSVRNKPHFDSFSNSLIKEDEIVAASVHSLRLFVYLKQNLYFNWSKLNVLCIGAFLVTKHTESRINEIFSQKFVMFRKRYWNINCSLCDHSSSLFIRKSFFMQFITQPLSQFLPNLG